MRTEINGLSVYYDLAGSGPPVVLVHGLGGTGEGSWLNQVQPLKGDFQVLTYDLRGHGQTKPPDAPCSLDAWVQDLCALAKAVGIRTPIRLAGHSLGGAIALKFAAENPDAVAKLAVVAGLCQVGDEGRKRLADRAGAVEAGGMQAVAEVVVQAATGPRFKNMNPGGVDNLRLALGANDATGYANSCRALAEVSITDQLNRIRADTLILVGEDDIVTPPAMAELIQAQILGSRLQRLPDCGHVIPWEQPEALNDALRTHFT